MASKVERTPFVISYVEILILESSIVSMRTPSIAVIVPLLETVPIAGVSLFIRVDFETVNFILMSFPLPCGQKNRMNVFILLVDEVVVGHVETVDISKCP